MPVIKGEKTDGRAFPRRRHDLLHRSDDAGPQGAAGRHVPLPRPELRARRATSSSSTRTASTQHAWTTSWGVSTRLIGGLIMTHSDDDGLVLPPRLAPQHVVIIPIFRSDDEKARVLEYCRKVAAELRAQRYADAAVRVLVDERDVRGGEKVWQWVKKGVPLRLEIGPRDMEKDSRVRRAPRPRAEGQAERDARGVRRANRRDAASRSRTACSRAPRRSAAEHTRQHRQPRRVLRVLHERARGGGEARRRSTAASRSRTSAATSSSRRRSRTTSPSPCAASRSRRASPARARSRASRARSAWSGRRRTRPSRRFDVETHGVAKRAARD